MAWVVVAVIVAACGSLPVPPTAPAPTPAPDTTPIPTATPTPTMAAGHLAGVAAAAGAQPWTRVGDKGAKLQPLPAGAIVYLIDAKPASDGAAWWQVPANGGAFEGPKAGWVAERTADGASVLEPVNPDCPPGDPPRSASELPKEPWFRLACYGHEELELKGTVTCQQSSGDGGLQGAPWMDAYRWCVLDDVLPLNGPAVASLLDGDTGGSVRERHAVRGHFDDPGSTHCVGIGLGGTIGSNAGPGEPGAIALCRQQFVVTELLPASDG